MPATSASLDPFVQLGALVSRHDLRGARRLAAVVRAGYVPVHDGFRDAVAQTLEYLSKIGGQALSDKIGMELIQRLMAGGDPPQYAHAGLRDRVRAIAFGWHWHATRITVTEDDEKLTFRLHPCGSGMRLLQENQYSPGPFAPTTAGTTDAPRLSRSTKPTASNFMAKEFPVYCNHCSEMSHVALPQGVATFLVEGWTPLRAMGVCLQHTFKNKAYVPDTFYQRYGLPVPARDATKPPPPPRLFTDAELLDLQTHPLDRLVDAAERGDWAAAHQTLTECTAGWRDAIHDVYRNWLCGLWLDIHNTLGPEVYEAAVIHSAPELFYHMSGASLDEWTSFWSLHLRLRSAEIDRAHSIARFVVGTDSLLQPNTIPNDTAWFLERLAKGIEKRGWKDRGTFAVVGNDIVHTVKESRA